MKPIPILVFCGAVLLAGDAAAATFTVNSTSDVVDANPGNGACATAAGTCTLRAAIQEANALAGADQINVPAGTYPLTINGAGENASATGDLDLTSNVTIVGAGPTLTIVDASGLNPRDRVFHALSNTVTLRRMKITGGRQTRGGGVLNAGATLTLTSVRVENNVATADGGGVATNGVVVATTITGSTITGNNAAGNGGGIANLGGAIVTVNTSTISNNLAGDDGAGLYNGLTCNAFVNGSTLTSNQGGGPFSRGGGLANVDGTLELDNTTVSYNTAGVGGGVFHEEAEFFGILRTFFLTVDHNNATGGVGGGGMALYGGEIDVNLTTVTLNNATGVGADGGGIYVQALSEFDDITFLQTEVSDNTAADAGGGMAVVGVLAGWTELDRSAVHGNDAGGDGGGVHVNPGIGFLMAFHKSTISSNHADDDGGGVFVEGTTGALATFSHVTIAHNDAGDDGGGVYLNEGFTTSSAFHMLLASNTASGTGDDCDGDAATTIFVSDDYNLIGDNVSCGFPAEPNDLIGVNPLLGALADNGGATLTHALLAGSPAIDAGHPTLCTSGGASDQRGMPQPVGECDIGAFERQ